MIHSPPPPNKKTTKQKQPLSSPFCLKQAKLLVNRRFEGQAGGAAVLPASAGICAGDAQINDLVSLQTDPSKTIYSEHLQQV